MGFDPVTMMAMVAGGTKLASGVVGYFGAKQSAQAEAQAAEYNAQVNQMNSQVAKKNSEISAQVGEAQMGIAGQKGRAQFGDIQASQGASGIDPNSGSAVDVRRSAASLAQMDAMTVRRNAILEAHGYDTQSASFKAQAGLDKMAAKNDIKAGNLAAFSSLLGGASGAGDVYRQWKIDSGNSMSSGYKVENTSKNFGNDYYNIG